jgi:hypothetical protein
MLRLLPVLAFLAFTAPVVALGAGPGPHARSVAAVYPPWWGDARIGQAAASAGAIAAGGGLRNVILVSGEPGQIAERARRSGALFLIDTRAARFCVDPLALSGDRNVL